MSKVVGTTKLKFNLIADAAHGRFAGRDIVFRTWCYAGLLLVTLLHSPKPQITAVPMALYLTSRVSTHTERTTQTVLTVTNSESDAQSVTHRGLPVACMLLGATAVRVARSGAGGLSRAL